MQVSSAQKSMMDQLRQQAVTPSPVKQRRPTTQDAGQRLSMSQGTRLPSISSPSPGKAKGKRAQSVMEMSSSSPQKQQVLSSAAVEAAGGSGGHHILLGLQCSSERNKQAVRATHDAIFEKARVTVLDRRRENSGPELSKVLVKLLTAYVDEPKWSKQKGGKGVPTVMVPTLEEAIELLGDERIKVAKEGKDYQEHMAKQMKWLIGELGAAKERAETWEEQYRLLLMEYAAAEDATANARSKQEAAEEYSRQLSTTLNQERKESSSAIMDLTRQVDVLRDKVCVLLEQQAAGPSLSLSTSMNASPPKVAKRRGSHAAKNLLAVDEKEGRRGSSLNPNDGTGTDGELQAPPSFNVSAGGGDKGLGFEQKEEYLRQIVHHKQTADEARHQLSVIEDKLKMAQDETMKQRQATMRSEAAREAEVASLKKLLQETRDANVVTLHKIENRCVEAEAQNKSLEITINDLQIQLQDSVSRLMSLQKVMTKGPSVQLLLRSTLEPDQADEVAMGLEQLTDVVTDFATKFNELKPKDSHMMLKEASEQATKKAAEIPSLEASVIDPPTKKLSLAGSLKRRRTIAPPVETMSRWTQVESDDVAHQDHNGGNQEAALATTTVLAAPPATPSESQEDEGRSTPATSVAEEDDQEQRKAEEVSSSQEAQASPPSPRTRHVEHSRVSPRPEALDVGGPRQDSPAQTPTSRQQSPRSNAKTPKSKKPIPKPVTPPQSPKASDRSSERQTPSAPLTNESTPQLTSVDSTSKLSSKASSKRSTKKRESKVNISEPDAMEQSVASSAPTVTKSTSRASHTQASTVQFREVHVDDSERDFQHMEMQSQLNGMIRGLREELAKQKEVTESIKKELGEVQAGKDSLYEKVVKLEGVRKDLESKLKLEQKNVLAANEKYQHMFLESARAQEQSDTTITELRDELKATQDKALQLQKDLHAALRSDERLYLCNKERILIENAERVIRCLTSAQSSTVCSRCLDSLVHPITLFPCGHVICEACFFASNVEQGIELPSSAQKALEQYEEATQVASIQDARDRRKAQESLVTKGDATSLEAALTQGQSKPVPSESAIQAAVKRIKMITTAAVRIAGGRQMYCEECGKVHVTSYVQTRRLDEVNEKITYVMSIANEVKHMAVARLVEVQSPLATDKTKGAEISVDAEFELGIPRALVRTSTSVPPYWKQILMSLNPHRLPATTKMTSWPSLHATWRVSSLPAPTRRT